MRCCEVQEHFSEIYDNQAEGQALLLEHIENCPECLAEYKAFSQLFDDVRAIPEPELPNGFHEKAMANIRAILPLNDSTIDNIIGGMETRDRIRESKYTKKSARTRSTHSAARRWAGIAAAACLLLVSLWAVRTSNFGQRHDNDYTTPQAMYDYLLPESEEYIFPVEIIPSDTTIYDEEENWDNRNRRVVIPEDTHIDFDAENEYQDWVYGEFEEQAGYSEQDGDMAFQLPAAMDAMLDDYYGTEVDDLLIGRGFGYADNDATVWGIEPASGIIGYVPEGEIQHNIAVESLSLETNGTDINEGFRFMPAIIGVIAGVLILIGVIYFARKKIVEEIK